MKRKLITILLVLAMVLTMLPMTALAADVSLPSSGDYTISTDNTVLDGKGATYTSGTITVNAANVTIKNLTFGDMAKLVVNTTGKFTLTGCTFAPSTVYVKKEGAEDEGVRTAVSLNVGEAEITNNTFDGATNGYYNAIEFGIGNDNNDLSKATISGNTFQKAIKNNYFNFYNMAANAKIDIVDNHFLLAEKSSNGIRISNPRNVSGVVFEINNNEYTYATASADSEYEGLILLQDYSAKGAVQDFTGITLHVTNLKAPQDAKQFLYVYDDDQRKIINTNQPKLTGDDASLSQFCAAKIEKDGEAVYFKTLTAAVAAAANGGTIDLLRNVSEQLWIRNNENVTLNLNGYTLSYKQQTANVRHGKLTVNGPGTIKENSPNFGPLMIKGSTTPSDTDYSVITINNATLEGWAPVFVDQNNTKAYGVKVSLNGATLNSKPDVSGNLGAGIYVNGQITDATNAPVINLDSTNVISTGEGMYLAGYAITTVNGGSVIGGQTGIEIRSGKLTLNGGTYTSNASEYICVPNGNGSTTSGAALAIAQHTTKKNIDVTIFDGTFTGVKAISESNPQENDPAPQVTMPISGGKFNGDLTIADSHKFISGGHFTVDPSEYKADSMYVVPSTEAGYTYMVTDQAPTTVPVIVKDETAVTVEKAEGMTDQDVENIRTKTEVDGVAEAVNENAVVAASGIDTKATNVAKVEVSVSVNVEVKETNLNVEKDKSMTFSATPVATVTTTDASGAELNKKENVAVPNSYLDGKPITVKLPLPAGFTPVEITHICADGTHEVFTSEAGDGYKTFTIEEGCAVLTITKFSEFILKNTATVAAKIGNVSYRSLQDAINAAKDGETITLVGNSDENVTIAGKSLIIDKNNFALSGVITLGSYCTMTDADGKLTVRYNPPATPIEAGTPAQMPFQEVAKRFDDVPADAWFATGVYYAAENGLMNGTGNNLFSPYANTTRGMIMTILARRSGVNTAGSTPWYAAGMNWAKSAGVSDGTNPTAAVTREQLVAMLFRYAAFNGMDAVTLEENLGQFADRESVSGWAVSAMNWAVGQGLVEGSNGLLRPKATATRAEVATILMRFCALLKK